MDGEGFREFWAAFSGAEQTIREAEEKLGSGDPLVAIAKAIQAQTLGLRLSAKEGNR